MINKNLFLIGGTSTIGKETAFMASKLGYKVVIGYNKNELLANEIVNTIKKSGGSCCSININVSDSNSVNNFFDEACSSFGLPDCFVNCSAISPSRDYLLNISLASIENIINVNLLGSIYALKKAIEIMATSRGGRGGSIVLLSSEAAKFGGNLISPYSASKGAINSLTIGVAREIAQDGLRLNAVSPGIIKDLDVLSLDSFNILNNKYSFDSIPLGRPGLPKEVSETIIWLLSDKSSYITGTIVSVSGGR